MKRQGVMKGQAAIELLSTYSWALLVIMAFVGVIAVASFYQRPSTYTSQYCYIEPELPCYGMYIESNSITSNAILIFSNNLGVALNFPAGTSFSVQPQYSNTVYHGSCYPYNAVSGNTVTCSALLGTFTQSVGSESTPKFYISYRICGKTCTSSEIASLPVYNTSGSSTLFISSMPS